MSKISLFFLRTNNPVLLRFLQNLSSAMVSDVLVQELVIKVLCCCQDVVKPFLTSLTVTYEPRLSLPWVTNMNLLTKVRNISTCIYYGTSNILVSGRKNGAQICSLQICRKYVKCWGVNIWQRWYRMVNATFAYQKTGGLNNQAANVAFTMFTI